MHNVCDCRGPVEHTIKIVLCACIWTPFKKLTMLLFFFSQEKDLRDVGDWRKNIEEKSGMEGRKKMFETES